MNTIKGGFYVVEMGITAEMRKYMDTSGEKPVIINAAPDHIKKLARELNEIAVKIEGSEHFIIEDTSKGVLEMFMVVDVFIIENMLSVTVEGEPNKINNQTILIDKSGNKYKVISVAFEKYNNPHDISRFTTFLTNICDLKKGTVLFIA